MVGLVGWELGWIDAVKKLYGGLEIIGGGNIFFFYHDFSGS